MADGSRSRHPQGFDRKVSVEGITSGNCPFGWSIREDFGPDSDIDFLVEFEPEHIPGLIKLAGMEIELSELLGGQKVDLRTPKELSRYFRRRGSSRGRGPVCAMTILRDCGT